MLHSTGKVLLVVPSAKEIWLADTWRRAFSADSPTPPPQKTGSVAAAVLQVGKGGAFLVGLHVSTSTIAAMGFGGVAMLVLLSYCFIVVLR